MRDAIVVAPSAAADEIVVRTNAERARLGLPALARNAALMSAAQLQANQMAALNSMAHECPGAAYPTMDARLDAVGYRRGAAGENVAEGYPSALAVVTGWMKSPGHRENIVDTRFSEMGAGVAPGRNGRLYYVQVFAHPR
ncbi:MAG: CAP domain-containing protein [Gemmatimonadaceae bacterium]